ncbi:MAG: SDR family NAD(P)-dependent oxidoreductase [Acidimicrobiales bacterium]
MAPSGGDFPRAGEPAGVAFVAGGAGAIGGAIARGLASAGMAVGIADLDGDAARRAAKEIEAGGARSAAVGADLSSSRGVSEAVGELARSIGPPRVVVHAMGIYPRSGVLEMAEEEWTRVLATNLYSAFFLCREVLPLMIQGGGGSMVLITSELGGRGVAKGAHYAASKAGLDALVRSVAAEVAGDGVSVNCIAPGLTDTPMMRGANSPQYIESVAQRLPGGRIGRPEDVVPLALFLAGPGARDITGQVYKLR